MTEDIVSDGKIQELGRRSCDCIRICAKILLDWGGGSNHSAGQFGAYAANATSIRGCRDVAIEEEIKSQLAREVSRIEQ